MVDPYQESNSILRRKAIQIGGELETLRAAYQVLVEAAKVAIKTPKDAVRIMTEALGEVEGGLHSFDPVTRRRLRDGAFAMGLPEPKTRAEAEKYLQHVYDGARALQSLDDLGVELNKKAMADMDSLDLRAKKVKNKFKLT